MDIDIVSPSQVFSPARFVKTGRGNQNGSAVFHDGHAAAHLHLETSMQGNHSTHSHSSSERIGDNSSVSIAAAASAGHCSPVTNPLTVLADSCIASAEKDRSAHNGLYRYTTSRTDERDSYRVSPSAFNPLSAGIAASGIGRTIASIVTLAK